MSSGASHDLQTQKRQKKKVGRRLKAMFVVVSTFEGVNTTRTMERENEGISTYEQYTCEYTMAKRGFGCESWYPMHMLDCIGPSSAGMSPF